MKLYNMKNGSGENENEMKTVIPVDDRGAASAPAKENGRAKKTVSLKAAALLCALCVVLSGLFGFGGTIIANRVSTPVEPAQNAETGEEQQSITFLSGATPVAALRTADDVQTSASASAGDDLTYAQVAAIVKDSVVEINTEYTTRNSWFQYTTGGAGSGVILSEDGYVITNAHVILNETMDKVADTVTVRLTDGTEYSAEVEAYDTDEDIAILKIRAKDLTPARCGDSAKLVVGEELIIVGNPLGELGGSVSNGIVSATEREIQVGGVTMCLIQTNAAVNPGNSGGGMFNMKGELVGIVNAKSSGTGIEGIGFAIPINQVVKVTDDLLTLGYVSGKPMIGVSLEDVGGSNGLSMFFGGGSSSSDAKSGVYVRSLVEGMNDKVLKEGDRIIAVNGEEIGSSDDVKAIVSKSAIGDKLTFQLYRDGKLIEVEVRVFERTPDIGATASKSTDGGKTEKPDAKTGKEPSGPEPMIGVSLTEVPSSGGLSSLFGSESGYGMKEGVYVASLVEGMNDKVLKEGDRIVAINGDEITSSSDVKEIVAASKIGDTLQFEISREGRLLSVEVKVFEKTEEYAAAENEKDAEPGSGYGYGSGDPGSGFDLGSLFGSLFGSEPDGDSGSGSVPDAPDGQDPGSGSLFEGWEIPESLRDLFDLFNGRQG
ncbi:MAG: trypsin-like peptidase domain-containing protein [Clostridia bacterium]|nr:trypsin-like peptidase domain-containing protein [Clostridia bacterium]